jgi:hypothetical protein
MAGVRGSHIAAIDIADTACPTMVDSVAMLANLVALS